MSVLLWLKTQWHDICRVLAPLYGGRGRGAEIGLAIWQTSYFVVKLIQCKIRFVIFSFVPSQNLFVFENIFWIDFFCKEAYFQEQKMKFYLDFYSRKYVTRLPHKQKIYIPVYNFHIHKTINCQWKLIIKSFFGYAFLILNRCG